MMVEKEDFLNDDLSIEEERGFLLSSFMKMSKVSYYSILETSDMSKAPTQDEQQEMDEIYSLLTEEE